MSKARAFVRRTIRAMKTLARGERIPKPLRWIAGIALLPIPGPVDEVVLILVCPLFLVYREPLREAWRSAGARRERRRLILPGYDAAAFFQPRDRGETWP